VYPADRIAEIREAGKLGIKAEVQEIDFKSIMDRMREKVQKGREQIRKGVGQTEELDFYEGEAHFTGDYTLQVNSRTIKGKKIFLASGARYLVPPIRGLENIQFLNNVSVLEIREKPESLIIIGGGDIAVEYAHFFSSMGTQVTIVQRNRRLVPAEEPEISRILKRKCQETMSVHTSTEVIEAVKDGDAYRVIGKDRESGEAREFEAAEVLLAAGRKSNADLLKVENTGVETDKQGYIKVNEYFETSKKNIWAFGDALGKHMFRHVANREAMLVWHNALHGEHLKMDFISAPHAVFTHPQIASVGLTESQAKKVMEISDILIGTAKYSDVAMGEAMAEDEGFAKAIIQKNSGKILGFHIIGPYASILIQEVVNAMALGGDIWSIGKGMHIHPALSELIISAVNNLEEP
jgi:dihydrolipoamide dehydrogenase